MNIQRFEKVPDSRRLSFLADLLSYESAAKDNQIRMLESEIETLLEKLERAERDLEEQQRVIDLQNAAFFAREQSK